MKNPSEAGRELRAFWLNQPMEAVDAASANELPQLQRVFGVLMDWPIGGGQTATVFATAMGTASLYTTAAFGILGGEAHERVREAAVHFVRSCDAFFDASRPAAEFPYPAGNQVFFYFLTTGGVRLIDADLGAIKGGASEFGGLFGAGQRVLTELRFISEKR